MNRESRIANPPRASDSTRSIYPDVAGGITTFFTITQGILWGFVLHALLYTSTGRRRDVPLALWVLAALSVVLLVVER